MAESRDADCPSHRHRRGDPEAPEVRRREADARAAVERSTITPRGTAMLAIDGVGAGVDEKVLVVLEGRAAGEALGQEVAPVDAAIVGIIDEVDVAG